MLHVVTGPPPAGKSSWIEARVIDIVIDLDRITAALTGPGTPAWNQHPIAIRVAHRARYAALDEALKHHDQVDVYLIHTQPSRKWLARYQHHQAEIITVDPGRDIVMQRVRDMRSPVLLAAATRWYQQHTKQQHGRPAERQASRAWLPTATPNPSHPPCTPPHNDTYPQGRAPPGTGGQYPTHSDAPARPTPTSDQLAQLHRVQSQLAEMRRCGTGHSNQRQLSWVTLRASLSVIPPNSVRLHQRGLTHGDRRWRS